MFYLDSAENAFYCIFKKVYCLNEEIGEINLAEKLFNCAEEVFKLEIENKIFNLLSDCGVSLLKANIKVSVVFVFILELSTAAFIGAGLDFCSFFSLVFIIFADYGAGV